jgi:hypothetical protein
MFSRQKRLTFTSIVWPKKQVEVKKLKKAILVFSIILLMIAAVIVPVLAVPTDGQKVPVILKFTPYKTVNGDKWTTDGNITQRRDYTIYYHLSLSINGATPLIGECVAIRDSISAYTKVPGMAVYHEDYVMSFVKDEGGFEGNAMLMMTDYVSPTNFIMEAHGVFHGTGTFEGQTINAWRVEGLPGIDWTGYLLKP